MGENGGHYCSKKTDDFCGDVCGQVITGSISIFLNFSGIFTSELYVEDCLFEDPTISFRVTDLYSRNLKLLVPFFDDPSIRLQSIEKVNHMNCQNT
ncbi:hypothetical protein LINPERPRIM_LOCUS38642 [Linum perenne]